MPGYNVQGFTYTNPNTGKTGTATMYGYQAAHNHAIAARFTPDAKDWLAVNWHWPYDDIEQGPFLSGQGRPAFGHELEWNAALGRWV